MIRNINYEKCIRLIKNCIKDFKLDLSGLVVLTEAATGYYSLTSTICALAGAKKVYAIAKDSKYGTLEYIKKITNELIEKSEVNKNVIEIFTEKTPDIISKVDIITNSGNVRPIDANMIKHMKPTAVVTLMYETWEFRKQDVDLIACKNKGIMVMGTDESIKEIDMFKYSGPLCLKLINKPDLNLKNSNFVVIGNNIFAKNIIKFLSNGGANISNINLNNNIKEIKKKLKNIDFLIISIYPNKEIIVRKECIISAKELKELSPNVLVVQFFGNVDRKELNKFNIPIVPKNNPGEGHMGLNIHALGPEPVIKLNTGSLKVGEIMTRARLSGKSIKETKKLTLEKAPGQDFKK